MLSNVMALNQQKTKLIFGWGAILVLVLARISCQNPNSKPQPRPTIDSTRVETAAGGIIRGDKGRKVVALAFTGHEFAEGGQTILNELQKHGAKASFFLTGKFISNEEHHPLVDRIAAEGHYFSVHSDQHLLYCSWTKERQLLVSHDTFRSDLQANFARYDALKLKANPGRFFIPPFEHYNQQIVAWADELGCIVVNYTPGTRSHADYTGESDKNFASSQVIFDSIVKREQTDPHGLNGFILLFHIGSGPGRADKFHLRLGELLDRLSIQGYKFIRVDELLAPSK